MAHVLVYLQRTPDGLHPGSAVALCVARDLSTERGATVTAVCPGDAGNLDEGIVRAASRFGADLVLFGGPKIVEHVQERLQPVHVLAPWTPEGLGAIEGIPGGPPTPRWLDDPSHSYNGADAVTAIIPGTLPWYDLTDTLEAEYEGGVEEVPLPGWVAGRQVSSGAGAPGFRARPEGALSYVAPQDITAEVQGALRSLGAHPQTPDYAERHSEGTLLWLDAGPNGLPDELAERDPAARVILLPGPMATFHPSWKLADWVLPGAWNEALRDLHGELWNRALA